MEKPNRSTANQSSALDPPHGVTSRLRRNPHEPVRVRLQVRGVVQGVGFRPTAHRLACEIGLAGWVANSPDGATVEIEGGQARVQQFMERLTTAMPESVVIGTITTQRVPATGDHEFRILRSSEHGSKTLAVSPDLATCDACRREMEDTADRRSAYPFLTCTLCGPRYSVLTGIPYDRARTTMARFPLCEVCMGEYESPSNRRYHAECTACPDCGPHLALWDAQGQVHGRRAVALRDGADLVWRGGILAVKGLGGFQLWADARAEVAVQRLRARKRRLHKPFALLFPSLDAVRSCCEVSNEAARLLTSPQAPIVILRRRPQAMLAEAVAPGNPTVGAMLPHTPLHHLLMAALGVPVVATSGNHSEEPIATDNEEALERLGGIADLFLVHDRVIARPIDDSVARVSEDGVVLIRRSRGYVPGPIFIKEGARRGRPLPAILAVGGHLKNTVGFGFDDRVLLSQHVGDLSTSEATRAFRQTVSDLSLLLERRPDLIACDLHPDYVSSTFAAEMARQQRLPLVKVQHHHAHVAACMAEHGLTGRVLGVAWDGSGYGPDGTLWGGEFLLADYQACERRAHLLPFGLPGGENAVRDPRRAALTLLSQTLGDNALPMVLRLWPKWEKEARVLLAMIERAVGTPMTSSMGRLFDAVASLSGLSGLTTFEGQAAMAVEFAADRVAPKMRESDGGCAESYDIPLLMDMRPGAPMLADWRPLVRAVLADLERGRHPDRIAYAFHVALANLVCRVAEMTGLSRVVLTGGCFQNMLLTELVRQKLSTAGFDVYTHQAVPPNDGGLALGQVMVAAAQPREA